MDAITAGTALIVVQLCVALVMTGTFYTVRNEKCTRYWALSGAFAAIGVLLIVLNAGAPRYAVLIIGNNSLVFSVILQWWGLQTFYKVQPGKAGWVIGAAFFLLFGVLLLIGAGVPERALLSSIGILLVFSLCMFELWRGQEQRWTFAGRLTLGAGALLLAAFVFRLVANILKVTQFLPNSNTSLGVAMVYLAPLAGTLLFSTGLILLYFERMVADKHYLATHDELTGLLNRRAIAAAGERDAEVALRLGRPLAVAFVDIDFFKKINDKFGHEAGDCVISEVARILKNTCRNIDLVGRYGGEEFCIILPGLGRESAALVGDRLVNALRKYRFRGEHPVTVSVGLALLPSEFGEPSWSGLVSRADKELYRAKAGGRDKFCIAVDLRNVAATDSESEPDQAACARTGR